MEYKALPDEINDKKNQYARLRLLELWLEDT
jgi:hypothetical protein